MAVEILTLEWAETRTLIGVREDVSRSVFSGEQSFGQWTMGEHADAVLPAEEQVFSLDLAIKEVIAWLVGAEETELQRFPAFARRCSWKHR